MGNGKSKIKNYGKPLINQPVRNWGVPDGPPTRKKND